MAELMIRIAGELAVVRPDGATIPLGSRKARRLLALLAAGRRRLVAGHEIVEALWPEGRPLQPADNVATLVSRLRAALGPGILLGGRAGYRLGPVPVDLDEAAALAAEAARRLAAAEPALALAAARRGLEIVGDGRVLVGEPAAAWLDAVTAEALVLVRTLRHLVAEVAPAVGDPAAGVGAARAAAADDALDERAHLLLMRAHVAAGEPDRALATFERLRTALADELGVDPSAEIQAAHLAILRPGTAAVTRRSERRPSRPAPPGRDGELAMLTSAWSAAAAGEASALLIAGEAGIGKTTLAEAAATLAADTGGLVLRARCYAAERSLFLQPVLDALNVAVGTLPAAVLRRAAGAGAGVIVELLPEAAGVLGEPEPALGDVEMQRRRAYDAVRGLVVALAAERPVLLLLDDLHNAGIATVELLHFLTRRAGGARLLVLVTVRSEEGAEALAALAEVAARLDVGPLPPDAVALLAARAGAPRLAEDILRRTRGHPLFVVETLRALTGGEPGVPASLQAAVLARLRHVGTDVERVLRAGAVLGASVAADLVAVLLDLPEPEVLARCHRATEARLLVAAGPAFEFANDLVQEVLYATTPAPEQLMHHRRAADLLADRPEALAGHAAAVGDWSRAGRAWLAAGGRALGRYAAADARALLDRALDAAARTDDIGLTGRVHRLRARAHEVLGDFPAAETDLRTALDAARAAGDRRLEMAALRQWAGDVGSALALPERERRLDTAMRIAVDLADHAAQADLGGWQAIVAVNRLRFTDAITLGRRAVAAGRSSGDPDALAAGLDGLKAAYAYLGEVGELGPVLDELEPLVRRRGQLQVLSWTLFESALPAVAAADWDVAVARIDEAIAVNQRGGMASHEPWLVAHLGWVQRLRGRLDAAVELGRQAVALSAVTAHAWWRSTTAALLATTLLELGETAEATRLLTDARPLAERGGTEAYVLRCLAALADATGDPEVLAKADTLLAAIQAPPGCAWLAGGDAYLSVGRAWLRCGDPARARAVLAPLMAAADRVDWRPLRAAAALVDAQALAALGEHGAAATQRATACALADRYGMPHLTEHARRLVAESDYSSSANRAAARAAPPGSTGR